MQRNLRISVTPFVLNILTDFPVMFNEERLDLQTFIGKTGSHRPTRESAPTVLKTYFEKLIEELIIICQ